MYLRGAALLENVQNRRHIWDGPWRNFAKTVILHSYLGKHICEEGWHNWDKKEAEQTVFYAEYENYGPGYRPDKRPAWVHMLTKDEAEHYTREKVLGEG